MKSVNCQLSSLLFGLVSFRETTGLISSGLWNKDGGEMLSSEYVKGLNQRLFIGGSKNVEEHKKLIRDMQLLKVVKCVCVGVGVGVCVCVCVFLSVCVCDSVGDCVCMYV